LYLVSCPPVAVLIVKLIRLDNLLSSLEDQVGANLGSIGSTRSIRCNLLELDIQTNKLVLSRNDHEAAILCRVNSAAHADIGKVGLGDDVHDTPDKVCRFTLKLETSLLTDPTACAVAAEDILGMDDLALGVSLLGLLEKLQVLILIVENEVTSEKTIRSLGLASSRLLSRRSLLLGQVS
jgi:hypothetical protein